MTLPIRPASLAFDSSGNLYFATTAVARLSAGKPDPSGKPVGSTVTIPLPPGVQQDAPLLLPAGTNRFWTADQFWRTAGAPSSLWTARISPPQGQAAIAVQLVI